MMYLYISGNVYLEIKIHAIDYKLHFDSDCEYKNLNRLIDEGRCREGESHNYSSAYHL